MSFSQNLLWTVRLDFQKKISNKVVISHTVWSLQLLLNSSHFQTRTSADFKKYMSEFPLGSIDVVLPKHHCDTFFSKWGSQMVIVCVIWLKCYSDELIKLLSCMTCFEQRLASSHQQSWTALHAQLITIHDLYVTNWTRTVAATKPFNFGIAQMVKVVVNAIE